MTEVLVLSPQAGDHLVSLTRLKSACSRVQAGRMEDNG
jgi:hypothetical protein